MYDRFDFLRSRVVTVRRGYCGEVPLWGAVLRTLGTEMCFEISLIFPLVQEERVSIEFCERINANFFARG